METKEIEIKLLQTNNGQVDGLPKNPRQIKDGRYELLKKSITDAPEMLKLRELLVYPHGGKFVIIGGNMRYRACKEIGYKELPCKVLDVDTPVEKLRQYSIKDNENFGEYDWDVVANEWDTSELEDWGVELPTDWGAELEGEGIEQKEIVEDEIPENVETKCKKGEIWQLGRHRLMCGDSTDGGAVALLMNGEKADMVMTDAPYGINAVGDNGEVGANFGIAQKGKYKQIIADDTTETAQQAYGILSQICDKIIMWGGNYFLDFLPPSDGWLIWDKRGESGIRNTFADGEMAWCSFHTPVRIYHQLWNGMIREGEHEKRVHPTQKPIRMLSEILQDFTNEGEIVLDVFGGSGSTLIACEQLNRTCYMMEIDPHYCDVIIARWEKLSGGTAVKIEDV